MKKSRILMGALALAVIVVTIIACGKEKGAKSYNAIKANAVELSLQHDMYVKQMLEIQAKKYPLKKQQEVSINDALDVIEEVVGFRPEIWMDTIPIDNNSIVVNLDTDSIFLADYSNTERVEYYLSSVDQILENMTENDSLTVLCQFLDALENDVLTDNLTSTSEKETIINAVEVLKGSLVLWDNILPSDNLKVHPSNWPRWRKLLFIAAADAVGAALGCFLGGFIIVEGIPIYMPPGSGAGASAAALSFLALKLVGWA